MIHQQGMPFYGRNSLRKTDIALVYMLDRFIFNNFSFMCSCFSTTISVDCTGVRTYPVRILLVVRGRPWRYSVIPSTPDFPTEYQIRRNSNPAGLPVFAAIWGPDFRATIIILTNMFKQIKQIRITLMTMFKVYPSPANDLR